MDLRKYIAIIEAAGKRNAKIDRSAFIYLEPKNEGKDFAQCSTCQHFLPGKLRCSLFGPDDKVIALASCGLYAAGSPHDDQKIINAATPQESGYVEEAVRCENCSWFNTDKSCGLYQELMQKMPDAFDLEIQVKDQACCNAWQKK